MRISAGLQLVRERMDGRVLAIIPPVKRAPRVPRVEEVIPPRPVERIWRKVEAVPVRPRELTRGDFLALGRYGCAKCAGAGLRAGRGASTVACECVHRAVCRAVCREYRRIQEYRDVSRVAMTRVESLHTPRRMYSRRREEFCADLVLIARRTLGEADLRLAVAYLLLDRDWKECARLMGWDEDPGRVFHAIYRIEVELGRAFASTRPYGVWPMDEYFGGRTADPIAA
jgi:hypothetical protein